MPSVAHVDDSLTDDFFWTYYADHAELLIRDAVLELTMLVKARTGARRVLVQRRANIFRRTTEFAFITD